MDLLSEILPSGNDCGLVVAVPGPIDHPESLRSYPSPAWSGGAV